MLSLHLPDRQRLLTDLALQLQQLAQQHQIDRQSLLLIGCHPAFEAALEKLRRYAPINKPVLLTGETGVGKEAFARALYLWCQRRGRPFLTVNCAQYQDENLIVSELFGHAKGSFTGATSDRSGLFEEAGGGVLFLDEVGELTPMAQAMLLRALSEGEIKPLGASRTRTVDVRVVAATNRDLQQMVEQGTFREDLYYRLRYLRLRIPPVRERGADWQLIAGYFLNRYNREMNTTRAFSDDAVALLRTYAWPGNVREIMGMVDVGFCMSDGMWIEPEHLRDEMELGGRMRRCPQPDVEHVAHSCLTRMTDEGECFWDVVYTPFLDRELNRTEVRAIIRSGLNRSLGSYKRLLPDLGIAEADYLKFMDFLRHHRLKPSA